MVPRTLASVRVMWLPLNAYFTPPAPTRSSSHKNVRVKNTGGLLPPVTLVVGDIVSGSQHVKQPYVSCIVNVHNKFTPLLDRNEDCDSIDHEVTGIVSSSNKLFP